MTITNNSQREAVLVSASSDSAGAVEIHQMSESNGMMNMMMVSDIHIPAQGKVTLKPDGYHLMLINLKKPINKGDIITISIHFQDGGTMVFKAEAKSQEADDPSSMIGMKM